jgi:hypothetical protein
LATYAIFEKLKKLKISRPIWSQSYDLELQRHRCKNLQSNKFFPTLKTLYLSITLAL